MTMIRTHILNTNGRVALGESADAETHFTGGEPDAFQSVVLPVWRGREGQGEDVILPSRPFVVHGELRSFSLLQLVTKRQAQERLQAAVLEAYRGVEQDGSQHVVRGCVGEAS